MAEAGLMRIGELADRTGMAVATLRAWERRYGIPKPRRTVGGHRLYSSHDVARIARIQRLVAQGWAVNAAAYRVRREVAPGLQPAGEGAGASEAAELVDRLAKAFATFDGSAAHSALDEAVVAGPLSVVLDTIVRPAINQFTAPGEPPVKRAQARFGIALLHTRLASLLADMTGTTGHVAVAAAVQGEAHDFATVSFAIQLAEAGWTVRLLGGDVAMVDLAAACTLTGARLALATAVDPANAARFLATLELPPGVTLAVAEVGFDGLALPEGVLRAERRGNGLVTQLEALAVVPG